ncbi:YciI family protein [Microtetraspora sp. AC03309]|uniref:YciI family protein n=1 Tax=Microtetraspora sp. AC03309 TaxID=2779376 RepID=UPI001E65A0A7|nr:YciI family protein [Microtetraspora sp. AC03309]MCC5578483.1 YciI family protein [Microtetraspora sp. AC03309]
MKYMIMTFGDASAWDTLGLGAKEAAWSPEEVAEHFRAMSEFYADLAASNEMVTGFGLADPSHTMTVEIRDGRPVASDGPHAEAKEVLAGFGIIDVASHDRAVELAARFAAIVQSRVELRPIMDDAGREM